MTKSKYGTASDDQIEPRKIPYPKSIFFIIGNEFCERFSYYGMRTILVLYFRNVLDYSENAATQAYHIFLMACYFMPILGAILADSLLGKFWTILTISIVYALGNIVISVASIHGQVGMTFAGLALIAIGMGGIKPCVSAFGGDQFAPQQKRELAQFFSMFYISINAGSLISTFVTPILRQDVACLGSASCYPLAFGVPAALMIVALALFIVGRFITRYVLVPPTKNNILVTVLNCIFYALWCKLKASKHEKRDHWLDYSNEKYSRKTVADVKALVRVLFLYLPLPIFWALYEQQGSRWTLQAAQMNGQFGDFVIKPDQVHVLNPLLIIVVIPVFEYAIYPLLDKINLTKPLRKMIIGGVLAGIAFLICAAVQQSIESNQPVEPIAGHRQVAIINGLPGCVMRMNGLQQKSSLSSPQIDDLALTIAPYHAATWPNIEQKFLSNFAQNIQILSANNSANCTEIDVTISAQIEMNENDKSVLILISDKIYSSEAKFDFVRLNETILQKPKHGGALMFSLFRLRNYLGQNFTTTGTNDPNLIANIVSIDSVTNDAFGYIAGYEIEIRGGGETTITIEDLTRRKIAQTDYRLYQGAAYLQLITGDMMQDSSIVFSLNKIVERNQINVFWQIVQYVVMTCAEIMFSITGLSFAYSQAPESMKSVLTACWHLTNAFGNLIIAIIADTKIFPKQSHEFFFFGGLVILDMLVFAVIAYYYVPPKRGDDAMITAPSDERKKSIESESDPIRQ